MIPAVVIAELLEFRTLIAGLSVAKNTATIAGWAKDKILGSASYSIPEQPFEDAFLHMLGMAILRDITGGIANPLSLTHEELVTILLSAMEEETFLKAPEYGEERIASLVTSISNVIARDHTYMVDTLSEAAESAISTPSKGTFLHEFEKDKGFFDRCLNDLAYLQYPPVIIHMLTENLLTIQNSSNVSKVISDFFATPNLKTDLIVVRILDKINSKMYYTSSTGSSRLSFNSMGLPSLPIAFNIIPRRVMFPQYDISFKDKKQRGKQDDKQDKKEKKSDSQTDDEGNILTIDEATDNTVSTELFNLALSLGGSRALTSLVRQRALSSGTKALPSLNKLLQ